MDQANKPAYTLAQLILYFLRLGTFGFGGPVALVGYMHRDLVERRGWISESDYKEGLALAQIAPGPLAAQLGIYLGFVHFRLLGATVAGLALVLPSITERSAACATKPVASKAINAVKRMKLIICAFS